MSDGRDQHDAFMRRAIEISRSKMQEGEGGPFGAVIVQGGVIIGEGWNRVVATHDPTAHAEIVAIRDACARVGAFRLADAEIYSSCEPCPMCLAAIMWARIERLYYANSRTDAAAIGFDDAVFYDEVALPPDARRLPAVRLLAGEARAVFAEWDRKADKVRY
jgi:tRNA(Arg) A34 adenosine deaminase TadA